MSSQANANEQSQAREVARLNNCPVKKIEVYQNSLGSTGSTTYRVQCNMPKTVGQEGTAPDTLLIGCETGVCQLMRTAVGEKK